MPRLPVEILESIIDLLHDDSDLKTLGSCCLVSRLCASLTRAYLFVHVEFKCSRHVRAWKEIFPDPKKSPAIHTRSLCINGTKWVSYADLSFIKSSFTDVERLEVQSNLPRGCKTGPYDRLAPFRNLLPRVKSLCMGQRDDGVESQNHPSFWCMPGQNDRLAAFHNLLPKVKSLCVGWDGLRPWELNNFISSFPSLDDLRVENSGYFDTSTWVINGSPPLMTGTLVLSKPGTEDYAMLLFFSLERLCFRKIVSYDNSGRALTDLVEKCSDTLECIHVRCEHSIDLSKAKKLKEVEFELSTDHIAQTTATLDTITPEHEDFQQVSICFPFIFDDPDVMPADFERVVSAWEALDRAIARLCRSHAICVKAVCPVSNGMTVTSEHVECFLPRTTAVVRQ